MNPEFIEEQTLDLLTVKGMLNKIEKRDKEINYRSNKVKEFLDHFTGRLSQVKRDELHKKLTGLKLTRIKEDHMVKIIDFLPKDVEELKIVLQAYPLSLPKKDQDAIIKVVKEYVS